MKNRTGFLFTLLVCIVNLFFFSCSSDDPVKRRQLSVSKLYSKGSVKIAVEQSNEVENHQLMNALHLAQKTIKEEKICPVEIELVEVIDNPTPSSGMRHAYEIASDDQVAAVISYTISDIAIPNSLIYQYYGLLMFNIISTSPKLTRGNNPLYFSNMPDDTVIAGKAAELCSKKGFNKILIYSLDSDYGMGLANSFEMNCVVNDITVVDRQAYSENSTEGEHIKNIGRWKEMLSFDAIFLAGQMPEVQTIYRLIRENGIDCPVVGGDTFDGPDFISSLKAADEGKVFAVSNFDEESENPAARKFYKAYKMEYNEEPGQDALQAYDALIVLAKAIASGESALPARLAEKLKETSGIIDGDSLEAKVYSEGRFKRIR